MSDSEDMREVNADDREETQAEKKRRVQRACDLCRKKKVKCDGASKENGICTNCATFNFECTYVEVAKKRGPPKGYVESVENRLERMEKLLTRLSPGSDFTAELGAKIADRDSFDLDAHRQFEPPGATPIRTRNTGSMGGGGGGSSSNSIHQVTRQSSPNCATSEVMKPWNQKEGLSPNGGDYDDDDEDEVELSLMKSLETFTLSDEEDEKKGFVGKSSGLHLIDSIRDFKYPEHSASAKDAFVQSLSATRRRKYWRKPPWEDLIYNTTSASSPSLWPPPDLIQPLVDSFFLHTNTFYPLLHRPTFEHEFSSRLYETNRSFAGLCLCVFALGARYVNDPRVSGVVADEDLRPYAKGWCFVQEFFNIQKSWGDLHHLHGVQALTLACLFVGGCSDPTIHWTLIGTALRACLDLGLHRRHIVRAKEPADAELHKRVFWVLYGLDRVVAGMLGRPVGVHDEDIDVDYPADVDDEFWVCEDPTQNMKQPANRPSQLAAFIALLKLQQIVGYCLRTIYAINKSKMMLNFNTVEAQQHIVAELDSGLNAWLDMVPKHLKWDPHGKDNIWFQQSAMLYSTYYTVQILVHRPFIPSGPTKPSQIGFPSLAICTNAARSGTHVIDVARQREHFAGLEVNAVFHGFMFSVVLLINVWGGKKSGSIGDPEMALKDVAKLMALYSSAEERWLSAGKLRDIIGELASQTNAPIPPSRGYEASHKRTRDAASEPEPQSQPQSQPPRATATVTRKRSTTGRKTSNAGRSASGANDSRPPSVISNHHPSPSVPSPHGSARGSISSMNDAGIAHAPNPSPYYPSGSSMSANQFGSPDAMDPTAGNALAYLPNPFSGLGLPAMSTSPAPLPATTGLPAPSLSSYANYFPPTNDPATLAQQAQFFAFLQSQNGGVAQQSMPQQQQQAPFPMQAPQQPQQQHGQLPFPHMPSQGFPPQPHHQSFQQQQQRATPSSYGVGVGGGGFEQGQGFDMSFFNPQLAMFGGPSPPSQQPQNGSGSSTRSIGDDGSSAWASAPGGFEIDDWSSYLANFAAESPAQTSTTNGHATPAHGGQPDHHRTSM